MRIRVCPKCNNNMKMLLCRTNPSSSEWYCKQCNKSLIATEKEVDDYVQAITIHQQQQKQLRPNIR